VIFILVLLLGNLRAGLIVASVIPLSMLFAISTHLFIFKAANFIMLIALILFVILITRNPLSATRIIQNFFLDLLFYINPL